MLKLFESIFGGGEQRGRYPRSLIEMAIEHTVDGTDPRLRAFPGYAKRLREPIIQAIDHVIALVEAIQVPIEATAANHAHDPRLGALFASGTTMLETLARDATLTDFLQGAEGWQATGVHALLLAERVERNILGMELVGEQVQREVAQVAVSFAGHRLIEPSATEAELRRQLRHRAFDALLAMALTRITEMKVERADLTRQRDLLRRRLSTLERGGWGFESAESAHPDRAKLVAELEDLTRELEVLGPDHKVLEANLGLVADLLADAERQLWAEPIRLFLDAMNIQRNEHDDAARRIDLWELRNSRGRRLTTLPLLIEPGRLPVIEDLVTAAQRYL